VCPRDDALHSHQPEEAVDGFTDAHPLELAGQVEGLRRGTLLDGLREAPQGWNGRVFR
jgi:hypothetical protein